MFICFFWYHVVQDVGNELEWVQSQLPSLNYLDPKMNSISNIVELKNMDNENEQGIDFYHSISGSAWTRFSENLHKHFAKADCLSRKTGCAMFCSSNVLVPVIVPKCSCHNLCKFCRHQMFPTLMPLLRFQQSCTQSMRIFLSKQNNLKLHWNCFSGPRQTLDCHLCVCANMWGEMAEWRESVNRFIFCIGWMIDVGNKTTKLDWRNCFDMQ